MRAKPIWNDVTSCRYKKAPSWGAVNDCKTITYTGSSANNSHELATVEIAKKMYEHIVCFNFYLDGKLLKQNVHLRNKDRAGDLIEQKTNNFINRKNVECYEFNTEEP